MKLRCLGTAITLIFFSVISLANAEITITNIEPGLNAGFMSDITIGADNLPIIAYYGQLPTPPYDSMIKVAHCKDLDCTNVDITIIENFDYDSFGHLNKPGIAIGSDDLPVVSYINPRTREQKIAHCNIPTCASFDVVVVRSSVNGNARVAIGSDGLPFSANESVFVHCEDLHCASITHHPFPPGTTVTTHLDLAKGSDGMPVITYQLWEGFTSTSDYPRYVLHCEDILCNSFTTSLVDRGAGSAAIEIGSDGYPIIAYTTWGADGDILKLAKCLDFACSSAEITTMTGDIGNTQPAIAVGSDGNPLVVYRHNPTNELRMFDCADLNCIEGTPITIISGPINYFSGAYPAITITPSDTVLISFVTGLELSGFSVAHIKDGIHKIDIDIKPGNKRNVINPRAKGGIWVAVLSDINPDAPFDPSSQVDIPTVEFGPDGAKAVRHKVKDINKDGLGDLLLRFKIPETGIACGDTEATLTGETFEGQSFTGMDAIKTVGCKPKKCHKKHHDDDRDDDKKHHGKHKEKKYHNKDHDNDHKKR